jgi:hypothetical protein
MSSIRESQLPVSTFLSGGNRLKPPPGVRLRVIRDGPRDDVLNIFVSVPQFAVPFERLYGVYILCRRRHWSLLAQSPLSL